MMAGTLLFFLAPRLLLGLFNASDEMMDIGVRALRIISIHFPLAAIAITLSSSFQAMGKGVYSLYMSLVRQLVFLLPAAYVLSHIWGLDRWWYAFWISEVVSITMSLFLFSTSTTRRSSAGAVTLSGFFGQSRMINARNQVAHPSRSDGVTRSVAGDHHVDGTTICRNDIGHDSLAAGDNSTPVSLSCTFPEGHSLRRVNS
jgi:hypothetical protein